MSREVLIANPPQECRGVTNFRSPPLIYPVQPLIAVYTDGSLNISCGYLDPDTGNCNAEGNLAYRTRCPYLSAVTVRRVGTNIIRLEHLSRRLKKESVLEVVYNLHTGPLIINPEQRWVVQSPGWLEGKKGPVPLTPTEYRLLGILLSNLGRVVGTETLKRHAFGGDGLYPDSNLSVYVYYLREKLGPLHKKRIIACIRGEGYSIPIANDETLA